MTTATEHSPTRSPQSAVPTLSVRGLYAGYGSTTVLRNVDLEVPSGGVVALLGANGAGKTTLLRAVAGLVRAQRGRLEIAGADHTRSAPHQRVRAGVCLIPEGRGIWRSLTVRENIRLQVPPWLRANDAVDEALEAFPALADKLDQHAGTLSGGQQQMVALCRAYLSEARVVLLDEVSIGLAPRIVDEIFESLGQLSRKGISLLLVEQYVERALELADLVVVLRRGEVAFRGAPAEVDHESLTDSYLGQPDALLE
jgi:branched-chain amino acid transport system ATP-binding protein